MFALTTTQLWICWILAIPAIAGFATLFYWLGQCSVLESSTTDNDHVSTINRNPHMPQGSGR